MESFRTNGTCARQIIFDVDKDNNVSELCFVGGCSGNLQALSKLVIGRNVDDVIEMLKGIKCRNSTSCPDQLSQALVNYKDKLSNAK